MVKKPHMKSLIILVLLTGCTQKYADYDLIRKVDFKKETYERPVPATQIMAKGKDELKECFNQWLFFSNAEKQKDERIPEFVRALCPGKDYLMTATFTETWWTTVIFTQSCIDIQTLCGDERRTK
jgi:hypothetical protein